MESWQRANTPKGERVNHSYCIVSCRDSPARKCYTLPDDLLGPSKFRAKLYTKILSPNKTDAQPHGIYIFLIKRHYSHNYKEQKVDYVPIYLERFFRNLLLGEQ